MPSARIRIAGCVSGHGTHSPMYTSSSLRLACSMHFMALRVGFQVVTRSTSRHRHTTFSMGSSSTQCTLKCCSPFSRSWWCHSCSAPNATCRQPLLSSICRISSAAVRTCAITCAALNRSEPPHPSPAGASGRAPGSIASPDVDTHRRRRPPGRPPGRPPADARRSDSDVLSTLTPPHDAAPSSPPCCCPAAAAAAAAAAAS
ncbi:MAG: hypothetical protein J3K34DRAFT_432262, partial [Monoraphidium minutum]